LMNHIDVLHFKWVGRQTGPGQPPSSIARPGVQIVLKTTLMGREFSRFVALRNRP
jgi:hypothetical protein